MRSKKVLKRLGSVRWFNDSSGEGYIRDLETRCNYVLHWSAIEGAVTPSNSKGKYDVQGKHWVNVKEGSLVEFIAIDDGWARLVEWVREVPDPENLVISQSLINFAEGLTDLEKTGSGGLRDYMIFYGYRNFDDLIEKIWGWENGG